MAQHVALKTALKPRPLKDGSQAHRTMVEHGRIWAGLKIVSPQIPSFNHIFPAKTATLWMFPFSGIPHMSNPTKYVRTRFELGIASYPSWSA